MVASSPCSASSLSPGGLATALSCLRSMAARTSVEPGSPSSTGPRRRGLVQASLLALVLLFPMAGGRGAVAEGEGAPRLPVAELARAGSPPGFQLQEVSISTGAEAAPADEVVSATYLGPGVRNEVTYMTFASAEAAMSFAGRVEPDPCSGRSLVVCSARVRNIVVTGRSGSTCPHPTAEVRDRAQALLDFGQGQLRHLKY